MYKFVYFFKKLLVYKFKIHHQSNTVEQTLEKRE